MADAVSTRCLFAALLPLAENWRTAYRKHLEEHQVDWWDPDAVWKHWIQALSDLNAIV